MATYLVALLLVSWPAPGNSQPKREREVWSYDGGLVVATDGSFPQGPCFRITGRATSGAFFNNLRRFDTDSGTTYKRGNEVVTQFPERLRLTFQMYDFPCMGNYDEFPTQRRFLTKAMIHSLRASFYWKRGLSMRPAPEVSLVKSEAELLPPYNMERIGELPERYQWWFDFEVPSAGVPLTDSLVVVLRTPDGRIAARAAARL